MNPSEDMEQRTALLAGASGLIGGHCLDLLLRDPVYGKVIVLARRPLSGRHPKLEQHIADFDRLTDDARIFHVDDVFCCLGTTIKQVGSQEVFYKVDCLYPLEIARLALKHSAKQFLIVTALGADPKSRVFYNRVKGEVEQKLTPLGFQALYIFRPSLLLGNRQEIRLGEEIVKNLFKPLSRIMVGPLKKYRPIEARTVAHAMVQTAKKDLKGIYIIESDRI